jgi:transposase
VPTPGKQTAPSRSFASLATLPAGDPDKGCWFGWQSIPAMTPLFAGSRQAVLENDAIPAIRNLGVDDWAWRKGQDYGTILVDLDLHRVADLLPDRSSESFSSWLQQHPGIATIARDRCGLYADGANVGAPGAQQVADRFHLVLNLSSAVERVFEERIRELVLPPVTESQATPAEPTTESTADPQTPPATVLTYQQQRRQRRLERYNKVVELAAQGYSQKAISRELDIQTKTIRRWLRAGQFPERKPPYRRPAKVTEFAEFLQERWREGCHNASRLYQEIREKGYKGKRAMVAQFVSGWRKTGKPTSPQAPERIAPKHAAILATRAADQMTEEQQKLFDRIAARCPDAIPLRNLALDFRRALSSSESWRMELWIELAQTISARSSCAARLWTAQGHVSRHRGCRNLVEHRSGRRTNQ